MNVKSRTLSAKRRKQSPGITTKEQLINEIDRMDQADVELVFEYIDKLKLPDEVNTEHELPSFKLRGKLDNVDIRSIAYDNGSS